jgi:hypothetical protein
MSKKTDNYEDQVLKEFEETQTSQETTDTVTDLGKVNINNTLNLENDPELKRITDTMGYINIPLDCLPSQGRFYPENTRISIRATRVGEIREFSIIDEEDPKDIRDKMTYIVSQCTRVYFGATPGHYKDLLEDDRIVLVLKIRELTFIDGQSSIKIPVPEGACSTIGCHPQETVDFNSSKLKFRKPSEKLERYYDPIARCYNVQTKKYGVITLYPPTIGVTTVIADWIRKQQAENKKLDVALIDILPYLIKDWRGLTDKQVFAKITELAGWTAEKFSLVLRLKEEINVGIEFEITEVCAQCGGELKIPVTFPDGFRSLFVPTISDFGDELL